MNRVTKQTQSLVVKKFEQVFMNVQTETQNQILIRNVVFSKSINDFFKGLKNNLRSTIIYQLYVKYSLIALLKKLLTNIRILEVKLQTKYRGKNSLLCKQSTSLVFDKKINYIQLINLISLTKWLLTNKTYRFKRVTKRFY